MDRASDGSRALWRLSASEIAAKVAAREVSAREVARDALARLEAVNPALNAIVDCRPEEVLAEADALDAALADGARPGSLCGVPITTKVNTDQRGFATTNGLRAQRDTIATIDSPVVANFKAAGAIILGRTNTPTLSARWFTSNQVHGHTYNPRGRALTPGGSSGGAGAAVAAGIGAIGHGTDIAGSVRYPAYACGVHGLRPSLGRIPAFNASGPERTIGAQLTAVSGPIARTIADLRLALTAMATPSARDPWYVPAPMTGPAVPLRAAICLAPDGLDTAAPVKAALVDAGHRLERAGWIVDAVEAIPPLREAADLQTQLWIGESYKMMRAAAEADGDPGLLSLLNNLASVAEGLAPGAVPKALQRRATLVREWSLFLERYAVVLLPISAEPPFPDDLDMDGEAGFKRVWTAQMPMIGAPVLGVPALAVATGLTEAGVPLGVQVFAARFREDLCLAAGEAIEAGGVPEAPIDPRPA